MIGVIPNSKSIKLYDQDRNVIAQGQCWDAKEVNAFVLVARENLRELAARIAENLYKAFKQLSKIFLKRDIERRIEFWEKEGQRIDQVLTYTKQTNARRKLLKRKVFYSDRIIALRKRLGELEEEEDKEIKRVTQ